MNTKRVAWDYLNEVSLKFWSRGYLGKGQTVPQRVKEIGDSAEKYTGIVGLSEKFQYYMSMNYYGLSTPVASYSGTNRGLPISCFGSYIPDDTADILSAAAEIGMMSKVGGGTSAFFGDVRHRGAPIQGGAFESFGPIHFIEYFDKCVKTISQGATRRGAMASYMPVEHPDIMEFLEICEIGHKIQEHFFGVTITNKWIEEMLAEPLDGEPEEQQKRLIWCKILERRANKGMPYIFFTDNANDAAPQWYKDQGKVIRASNLCTEIMESTNADESFVCCLSSMNLVYYEEWKDTDAVETLFYVLDGVTSEFIDKASKVRHLHRAVNFAKKQRALGLGALGWHSFLQSKMIPFESFEAKQWNAEIFKFIQEKSLKANKQLAEWFGEPEDLKGYGVRCSMMNAVAPNTSSSILIGQPSQSIEPWESNYFINDSAKVKFTQMNPYLEKLLIEKEYHTEEVLDSILIRGGSVQHLGFLTQHEKDVFKTFGEISQKEIIIQAAQRQKYIDQGQSVNLMIPPGSDPSDVTELILLANELGLKSLYYQRSSNPVQELAKNLLACVSCEG